MLLDRHIRDRLFAAAIEGKLETVRNLIDSYSEACLKGGYFALCCALKHKHIEIAKLLLVSGAAVDFNGTKHFNTPLHFACMQNDIEVVKMILDRGCDVNVAIPDGRTSLFYAIDYRNVEIAKLLLSHNADVNARDKYHISPLHIAVKVKCSQIVQYLLERDAEVNSMDTSLEKLGLSPLHLAARYYDEKVATLLLNNGANINIRGLDNITPLYVACEEGYEDAVILFLNKGADINTCTNDNLTPLHIAIEKGHRSVARLLLQRGANVDDQDKHGKTILHYAVERGCISIVQDVLKYYPDINNENNRSSLKTAILRYGEEYEMIVEALLEYGFCINLSDANDGELLHDAVGNGYLKVIESLFKSSADVNLLHNSEYLGSFTLLHTAVVNKQEEMVKLLINYRADINAQDCSGRTPIYYATRTANVKITNLLLANRASIKEYPKLLVNAVEKECMEIVKTLLHYVTDIKGAKVDAETKDGMTALHMAIQKGNTQIVKILLEYNANVNYKMRNNITPLQLAAEKGFREITEILLNFGADVNSEDDYGRTALYIAFEENHQDVVTTLLEYGSGFDFIDLRNEALLPPGWKFTDVINMEWYSDSDDDDHDEDDDDNDDDYVHDNDHDEDDDDHGRDDDDADYLEVGHLSTETSEVFKRHLIKLKIANLYVNEKILESMGNDDTSDFEVKCIKEIANMKCDKINSKCSFYDILVKETDLLSAYMKNKNIVDVLQSENYKTKFPIYAGMLKCSFTKAMRREEIRKRCNEVFYCFLTSTPKLLYDCSEEIVSYLDEENLKRLIEACSSSLC